MYLIRVRLPLRTSGCACVVISLLLSGVVVARLAAYAQATSPTFITVAVGVVTTRTSAPNRFDTDEDDMLQIIRHHWPDNSAIFEFSGGAD